MLQQSNASADRCFNRSNASADECLYRSNASAEQCFKNLMLQQINVSTI